MKLTIRNRAGASSPQLDSLIEQRVSALGEMARIDDASVTLEHRGSEASPSFRAEVHVAIPGPDLRAEAIDHTALNAVQRAISEIEGKLRARIFRRERKLVGHRKHPANFRIGRRSR